MLKNVLPHVSTCLCPASQGERQTGVGNMNQKQTIPHGLFPKGCLWQVREGTFYILSNGRSKLLIDFAQYELISLIETITSE